MFFWSGKLQIISGKFQSSRKFQNNVIDDVRRETKFQAMV